MRVKAEGIEAWDGSPGNEGPLILPALPDTPWVGPACPRLLPLPELETCPGSLPTK